MSKGDVLFRFSRFYLQNASTPYEDMYQTIFRVNSIYDEGHWFYNSMDRIDPEVVVPGGVCKIFVMFNSWNNSVFFPSFLYF